MIPRIDYGALIEACASVGYDGLPQEPPKVKPYVFLFSFVSDSHLSVFFLQDPENNEDFLRALHHALFNIEIVEGAFVCAESGREFKIEAGIPNMVLDEDEI